MLVWNITETILYISSIYDPPNSDMKQGWVVYHIYPVYCASIAGLFIPLSQVTMCVEVSNFHQFFCLSSLWYMKVSTSMVYQNEVLLCKFPINNCNQTWSVSLFRQKNKLLIYTIHVLMGTHVYGEVQQSLTD